MCTVMFFRETLPAEKRSVRDSRQAVDRLMEYDRELSAPFGREELKKIFSGECPCPQDLREDYELLAEDERRIVNSLGLTPPPSGAEAEQRDGAAAKPDGGRRRLKAALIETPHFDGSPGFSRATGNICVWLDGMNFGNSDKKGFYYVRWYNSLLDCGPGGFVSTAYGHPALIVQKNKLRPDQIDYMERKCRDTLAERGRESAWGKKAN